jgi:hypothetical protein
MPILAEPDRKRRRTWLLALLAMPGAIFLLLAGLVAWSWDHPVHVEIGGGAVSMSRTPLLQSFHWESGLHITGSRSGYFAIDVPLDPSAPYGNPYVIRWGW